MQLKVFNYFNRQLFLLNNVNCLVAPSAVNDLFISAMLYS